MLLSSTTRNFIKHFSRFKKLSLTPQNIPIRFSSSSSETSQTDPFVSPYLSVDIRCHKHHADLLSESLLSFGAISTAVDELDHYKTSHEICINSIFPDGHDVKLSISRAADSIGLKEIPGFEVNRGEQWDWITKSQESFNPVKVTEGLWIVPEWKVPPDDRATNIILNPGLAFGTGEHPTTKLCLLLLHSLIKGGERFLDYGTGSGVLAIAALKLGCSSSVGIDIEPQAIESARQNAALNNVEPEKLQLHLVTEKAGLVESRDWCGVEEAEKYDVVVANILLNPLLDLAESIVSYGKPGSIIGLSGILSEQVPYILERYWSFLEGISVTKIDDWALVCGRKKNKS